MITAFTLWLLVLGGPQLDGGAGAAQKSAARPKGAHV